MIILHNLSYPRALHMANNPKPAQDYSKIPIRKKRRNWISLKWSSPETQELKKCASYDVIYSTPIQYSSKYIPTNHTNSRWSPPELHTENNPTQAPDC